MEENLDLFKIFAQQGKLKRMLVYPVSKTENDPYEHTKDSILYNPIPVLAVIRNLSFSRLIWELQGLRDAGTKEAICERRYKDLLLNCGKIEIDDEVYGVYQDATKNFQLIEKNDYIVVLLEKVSL